MTKKIGITGLSGFVGTHLRDRLSREQEMEVLPFEDGYYDNPEAFVEFAKKADVIVHLAGVNRHEPQVVYQKNIELMEKLLEYVDASGNKPCILFSSSTQIERDNEYGRGKKRAMELLEAWSQKTGAFAVSMVVPNVFGDGGRPFYNSVVATFCYQVTHGQQPTILHDGLMTMIYINNLVEDIVKLIKEPPGGYRVEYIKPRAEIKVSELLTRLNKYKDFYYGSGMVPSVGSDFERDLYNTFITYMDASDWERHLKLNTDERGSFVEVFKLENGGQVSFSTTRPGITRGNHYHIRKNEKFCVVSGQASIKLRRIGTDKVIEYKVSGDKPSWVEMPIYYTHNITNIGEMELVTLFWINEHFNPDDPDTFFEKV
ncbi:MAG: NAD-dependent epimerase/dehydratase family protein [Planctomycetales bacterium]|nr:NAD-dependent epimerase/dehydratase family protein [Planctomycetales bacterium]